MTQESLNSLFQVIKVSQAIETLNKGIFDWKNNHEGRDPDLVTLNLEWFQELKSLCSLFIPLDSDDLRYQGCYLYNNIKLKPVDFVKRGSFYFLDSPEFSLPPDPFPFIPYKTF